MNRTELIQRLDLAVQQWFREMDAAGVPRRVFEGAYRVTIADGDVTVERDKDAEAAADEADKAAIAGKHYGQASTAALLREANDRKLDIADAGRAAAQDELIAALMTDDRARTKPPEKPQKATESDKAAPAESKATAPASESK